MMDSCEKCDGNEEGVGEWRCGGTELWRISGIPGVWKGMLSLLGLWCHYLCVYSHVGPQQVW